LLFRSFTIGLALLAMLFVAGNAKAGCGDFRKAGSAPALPWMNQGGDDGPQAPTIVGLWHLTYTQEDGSPFNQTFKTWHADGTEFEQAFLPPGGGNICFGVWKETGLRTVKLHHVGLMFAPDGSIAGSFTIDEIDTVTWDGKTYKGTFDFKSYDASGNAGPEIKGTTAATRISVNTPSTSY
jgi:hypothetical protein